MSQRKKTIPIKYERALNKYMQIYIITIQADHWDTSLDPSKIWFCMQQKRREYTDMYWTVTMNYTNLLYFNDLLPEDNLKFDIWTGTWRHFELKEVKETAEYFANYQKKRILSPWTLQGKIMISDYNYLLFYLVNSDSKGEPICLYVELMHNTRHVWVSAHP